MKNSNRILLVAYSFGITLLVNQVNSMDRFTGYNPYMSGRNFIVDEVDQKKENNTSNKDLTKNPINYCNNITNLNKKNIYDFQYVISNHSLENNIRNKYIIKFVNLFLTNDKNTITYNHNNFLCNFGNYENYDMKILCDVLCNESIQNLLKEQIRERYIIDYYDLLNKLDSIIYHDENCHKLLPNIVILTAFDNKSINQFYKSIVESNNEQDKQNSINEFLLLLNNKFVEFFFENDKDINRNSLFYEIINSEKDLIQEYAKTHENFNIQNIINIILNILTRDSNNIKRLITKYKNNKNIRKQKCLETELKLLDEIKEKIITLLSNINEQVLEYKNREILQQNNTISVSNNNNIHTLSKSMTEPIVYTFEKSKNMNVLVYISQKMVETIISVLKNNEDINILTEIINNIKSRLDSKSFNKVLSITCRILDNTESNILNKYKYEIIKKLYIDTTQNDMHENNNDEKWRFSRKTRYEK